MKNKDMEWYFREVRSLLPGGFRQKRKLIAELQRNLSHFLEEAPDADYDAIVLRFGRPEQIAASYVEEMEPQEVLRGLHGRKKIVSIVAAGVAAMALIWAIGVGICVVDSIIASGGYWVVYVDQR